MSVFLLGYAVIHSDAANTAI